MRKYFSVALIVSLAVFSTGCTSSAQKAKLNQDLTGAVLSASKKLVGTRVDAVFATNTGAACGDSNVQVDLMQPRVFSSAEFYDTAAENVIRMITAIRSDENYAEFGLSYSASMSGLIDKYGNTSDDAILWLCYTPEDVASINLSNRPYLDNNILDMNTLGQDDVQVVLD